MTGPIAEMSMPRRMHLNESPLAPSPAVVAAIAEAAAVANRYPEQDDPRFYEMLAAYAGVEKDRLAATSGSNEFLHLLPLVAGAPGAGMVVPEPSFPTYRKVSGFHDITVQAVPVRADGVPDVDAILGAITGHTRLVCVPSPNNPTGGLLTEAEIVQLVSGVPASIFLHFDEAYYEFGREAGGVETLPILEQRKGPWASSRSFSKAFGLAGIRLGYTIASDVDLATRIRGLRPNFCVNALAWAAGKAALSDLAHVEAGVAGVAHERRRLSDGLSELGLSPLPSAANFVSFPVPPEHPDLAKAIQAAGILTTTFKMPDGTPAIRVTTGTPADTDAFLATLAASYGRR